MFKKKTRLYESVIETEDGNSTEGESPWVETKLTSLLRKTDLHCGSGNCSVCVIHMIMNIFANKFSIYVEWSIPKIIPPIHIK